MQFFRQERRDWPAVALLRMVFALMAGSLCASSSAATLPSFDFTQAAGVAGWTAAHDLKPLQPLATGLQAEITGNDPYLIGPPRDYPSSTPLWINLTLRSDQSGTAQIFYFTDTTGPSEAASIRFAVRGGDSTTLRIAAPSFGPRTRLRFDPPGSGGVCVLQSLSFSERPLVAEPKWPRPPLPTPNPQSPRLRSGPLEWVQAAPTWGGFALYVAGQNFAIGNSRSLLGYQIGARTQWIELTNEATVTLQEGRLSVETTTLDPDGARWSLKYSVRPMGTNTFQVESQASVDRDRAVLFLPLLTLLPGAGSFGTNKVQGLFAGVEYLENEPSSSEADIHGPASQRKVPDTLKNTFPLMAIAAADRFLGLSWTPHPDLCALHDSPDRTFGSGGHLFGCIFPGSDPSSREDGALLPYGGKRLRAGQSVILSATIVGGMGSTVIPAVQAYVDRNGLPTLPPSPLNATDYFRLAAHGWLDSAIRDGIRFRHAVGATFGSTLAADALMYLQWLAPQVSDLTLSNRLMQLRAEALPNIPPATYNQAAVGHVRHPVEALVFGSVLENAAAAAQQGTSEAAGFRSDGTWPYVPPSGGIDLGSTHFSNQANGLAAPHVVAVLESAAVSGDRVLLQKGLRLLRQLATFRNTVPRGAQTWEVPLHTPDILASAHLVRAFTLGYEFTGDTDFLEQARYWAWTGVPFVYLTPPTDQPVGVYSTTPVLGATTFIAPVWIGLPVQWCGLVYGDAIRRLARHDSLHGPLWTRLANGIAIAGIQHTHPATEPDRQGLLPDSYDLRNQIRNPVPINPATLLPEAMQALGTGPVYDFQDFRHHGIWVHAPGPIREAASFATGFRFRVEGWPQGGWWVLLAGFSNRPRVLIDGVETPLTAPHMYQTESGRLALWLSKPATVECLTPARDALRIRATPMQGAIRLSWPANLYDFEVLQSASLTTEGSWQSTGMAPSLEGFERAVVLTPSGEASFFRLSGPRLLPP